MARSLIYQNIVAKVLVKYNIDYLNDPEFTASERSAFEQVERDLGFYDEQLGAKRREQLSQPRAEEIRREDNKRGTRAKF